MEFHVHAFTTHQAGPDDGTPLELISAARLQQLLAIEAAATALTATVAALVKAPADAGAPDAV